MIEQNLPAILAIGAAIFTGGVIAPFLGITSTFGVGALSGFVGGFVGSGGNIEAGIIGALTGGIGAAAGAGIGGMLTRAAVSCVSSAASGGNCAQAALASGFSEWAGGKVGDLGSPAANMARNAVIGGTVSALGGGKFANGAVTGAFTYLYAEGIQAIKTGAAADAGGPYPVIRFDSGTEAAIPSGSEQAKASQDTPAPLQVATIGEQIRWCVVAVLCWYNGMRVPDRIPPAPPPPPTPIVGPKDPRG